jgi:hypothetical protein
MQRLIGFLVLCVLFTVARQAGASESGRIVVWAGGIAQ